MENVAILGASPKTDRYSNRAQNMLLNHGHRVFPVNPAYQEIDGHKVYPNLESIQEPIHTVTLYVGPARNGSYLEPIVNLKPKRVIFNPGTENSELQSQLEAKGIRAQIACTLVLLSTNQYDE